MSELRVGVEGLAEPGVVAERVDDWRHRFAPAGSTSEETLWVTSPEGKSRSPKSTDAAWKKTLAQLAAGQVRAIDWEPTRRDSQFPIDVTLQTREDRAFSRVAVNALYGVVSPAPPGQSVPGPEAVLEWTSNTVAALGSGIGWGDSISVMLNRLGSARVDVREGGLEVQDEGQHGFADAWWAMWISGPLLQGLGGVKAVLSGWPGSVAEDQSVGGREIVFTMLADTPELVEHAVYLEAFAFLRPVLARNVEPRFDPAHVEESFQLLIRDVPPHEWPEHLRPLAWPWLGTDDAPAASVSHIERGPTNEELRSAPMPGADPELFATFKTIAQDDDGERIGPLIVSHPERGVLWASPEEMLETDARALANQRQWRYSMTT